MLYYQSVCGYVPGYGYAAAVRHCCTVQCSTSVHAAYLYALPRTHGSDGSRFDLREDERPRPGAFNRCALWRREKTFIDQVGGWSKPESNPPSSSDLSLSLSTVVCVCNSSYVGSPTQPPANALQLHVRLLFIRKSPDAQHSSPWGPLHGGVCGGTLQQIAAWILIESRAESVFRVSTLDIFQV